MQNEPKPILNKIPFWIADAGFLIAALVIAFTGAPGMTAMEAFWMVFCVSAGAALLAVPYYLEFSTHARLHTFEHDQASWDRVRKLDMALESLSEAHKALEGLDKEDHASEAIAELETRIGVLQKHVSDQGERSSAGVRGVTQSVKELKDGLSESVSGLEEKLSAVSERLEGLIENQASASTEDAGIAEIKDALNVLSDKLDAQASQESEVSLEPVLEKIQGLQDALTGLHARLDTIESASTAYKEESAPAPAYGKRSLMDKAFGGSRGGSGKSAIGRIISSRDREDDVEDISEIQAEASEPENVAEEAIDDDGDELAEVSQPEAAAAGSMAMAAPLEENEEEESQIDQDQDTADEMEAESASASEQTPVADMPSAGASSFAAVGAISGDSLDLGIEDDDAEEPVETAPESSKNSLGQTRITVHALIGIGNKPYVRGDGPGLSWERGVVMDFVEIGKWEWKTMRAQKPFEYQIWLNDEKPAEGEAAEIEAGMSASISPRFPA